MLRYFRSIQFRTRKDIIQLVKDRRLREEQTRREIDEHFRLLIKKYDSYIPN